MRRRASQVALLVAGALALCACRARACGPEVPEAAFYAFDAPEYGEDAYLRGRLGFVSPFFSTFDLVVVYRHLAGIGVSDAARAALVGPPPPAVASYPYYDWLKAREATGVELPERMRYAGASRTLVRGQDYLFFENCQDDAFRAATRTLADRLESERALTPAVRDWIAGQDSVFANCGRDSGLVLPAAAPASAPAWLRQDRAYQSAAARFYAMDFDGAAREFERIAADGASSHRNLAAYLVARAWTRKGTLGQPAGAFDARELERARGQVDRILADRRLADVHEAARRLRSFLDFRLDQGAAFRRLSRDASAPVPGADARTSIVDLAKLVKWYSAAQVESLAAGSPDLELADWLASLRSSRGAHALARFRQGHREQWLVAALLGTSGADPEAPEVMIAAAQVKTSSPAYETVTLERLRLHAERGEPSYVRQLIDACLAGPFAWSRTALNVMHGMRALTAKSLDEFVADVPRVAVSVSDGGDVPGPMLEPDGAAILSDRMPLAGMVSLAGNAGLPAPIRARIALAAWTRAALLDRPAESARVTPLFVAMWPALDSSLAAYRKARSPAARRFEAAWFLLNHPGSRPVVEAGLGRVTPLAERDALRDNLWCAPTPQVSRGGLAPSDRRVLRWYPAWEASVNDLEVRVVSPVDRAQAARERLAWRGAGPGVNWLCGIVLAEVRRNPRDPRLPEALHLCVLMTRVACGDAETTQWSRRAFRELHGRYAGSPWAARTKYWY